MTRLQRTLLRLRNRKRAEAAVVYVGSPTGYVESEPTGYVQAPPEAEKRGPQDAGSVMTTVALPSSDTSIDDGSEGGGGEDNVAECARAVTPTENTEFDGNPARLMARVADLVHAWGGAAAATDSLSPYDAKCLAHAKGLRRECVAHRALF